MKAAMCVTVPCAPAVVRSVRHASVLAAAPGNNSVKKLTNAFMSICGL
jgi:hypothetical protein